VATSKKTHGIFARLFQLVTLKSLER